MHKSISFRTVERGRFHVIVRQMVPGASNTTLWPVLYLTLPEDQRTRVILYAPLLDFFEEHSALSYRWMKNVARALGLLVDFAVSTRSLAPLPRNSASDFSERSLIRGLALSLLRGTVQTDEHGRAFDHTGLFWTPLGKRQASVLLSALTRHFNWLKDDDAASRWVEAVSTRKTSEDPVVSLRMAFELLKRKETSFLGHIKAAKRAPAHAFLHIAKAPSAATYSVPTFPSKCLGWFLHHGFRNRSGRMDDTARLVAHLLFALGLRKSEAFHLFLSDVQFVRDQAHVFLHHPEFGNIIDGTGTTLSRSEYLIRFGLMARTLARNPFRAGWKGVAGDEHGALGHWLPIGPLRARTTELLKEYVYLVRPRLMAARPKSAGSHPFLLVGRGSRDTQSGDPYTMAAFEEAWRAAIARMGRFFDDPTLAIPRKANGTTPHGARHFYGRYLFTLGVDGEIIRQCMHHRSLEAHKVYTRLTPFEVNSIINSSSAGASHADSCRNVRDRVPQQF